MPLQGILGTWISFISIDMPYYSLADFLTSLTLKVTFKEVLYFTIIIQIVTRIISAKAGVMISNYMCVCVCIRACVYAHIYIYEYLGSGDEYLRNWSLETNLVWQILKALQRKWKVLWYKI